jgi:proteic killer suppression protein
MIKSFRNKKLKRFFDRGDAAALPADQVEKISDILAVLDTAAEPSEVGLFPGWRLHPLKGDLKGFWSVTITGNWRLIFRFEDGDAVDLDLVDYH